MRSHSCRYSLLLTTSLTLAACTEPSISHPTQDAQNQSSSVTYNEVTPEGAIVQHQTFYDAQELSAKLETGEVELRPDSPFRAVYVAMATTGFIQMRMAYQTTAGPWTEFTPVHVDEDVLDGARLRINLPETAQAIRLHASQGHDKITFLTARHYSKNTTSFAIHNDIPGNETSTNLFAASQLVPSNAQRTHTQTLAHQGRYNVPANVASRGAQQHIPYEEATLNTGDMDGTRRLARYIKERFPQVILVEGYYNRPNTTGNGLSVHAAGRALDLFIRKDLSVEAPNQADNDLGDPVANWLISNAESIGITYLIWDRTKWSGSQTYPPEQTRHARYGGTHAHDDHIHLEISTAAGNLETDFFQDPTTTTTEASGSGMAEQNPLDPTELYCFSRHKAGGVQQGDCTQGEASWGDCSWYRCNAWGVMEPTELSACTQNSFSKREGKHCGDDPTSTGNGCYSRTLDREVARGECVQIEEGTLHCGACSWMICRDAGMQCINQTGGVGMCGEVQHHSLTCQLVDEERAMEREHKERLIGSELNHLLVMTLSWPNIADLDLVVQEPSGQTVSYTRSEPTKNDGEVHGCNPLSNSCGQEPAPYKELAWWGQNTRTVEPGNYTVFVRNYSAESTTYTVTVERYDADGNRTELDSFTGTLGARYSNSNPYEVEAGTVTVPVPE